MVAAFIAVALASPRLVPDYPNLEVVVFRHHPGRLDTPENFTVRDQDARAILRAVKNAGIGNTFAGGLGSGYELSIRVRDLTAWMTLVDRLITSKALGYYQTWGLNDQGLGVGKLR